MQADEPPVLRSRAVDRAYEELRGRILVGEYEAGARLGEAELAELIGVSRTPVRDALRLLAADGMVEFLPNRGARVSEWSEGELRELYEIRALLESFAAQKASVSATPADIEELSDRCSEMEFAVDANDVVLLTNLNSAFHDRIATLAGNERLGSMIRSVRQMPLVLRTFHDFDQPASRRSMGHHREIVAALRAGDSVWAGAVMTSHIHAARDVLLSKPSAFRRDG